MGCLASKESSVMETSSRATNNGSPAMVDNKAAITTAAMVKEDGLNPQSYRDETDGEELVFYDALESFSLAIGNMSYAPTSTMIPGGRSASVALPKSMLLTNPIPTNNVSDPSAPPTSNKKGGNARQSVIEISDKLIHGNLTIRGYPGQLDETELNACLEFRDQLKKRDSAYREMVHAYSPAEDEAFALCRFLRAREFDVNSVFAMLEDNKAVDVWKQARDKEFYQDLEKVYNGCPLPVFMKLFPVVISGLAKNGATMFYFKPGGMDMNALECVANLPELVPYLWYMLHQGGISSMQREVKAHGNDKTVLSERIIVFDMKNISSALFNTEFMKEAAKITACFPETMNRTYMLNVPTAFTVVWAVAKLFMEARTIAKIGFFAWESRAKQDLLNFVDSNELLSDYGGTGPAFDDVLRSRQAEVGSCSRWIVECLIATTGHKSSITLELSSNESASFFKVFSKGDNGAHVTVTAERNGSILIPSTPVKRDSNGPKGGHYSVTLDGSKLKGTNRFKIEVKGSVKEYYLVVIGVETV
ncbi:CRAL/TRIO domain containing protein [Nitzschia inconspicua]|uniref:CRAL/TRIO domain containing protein n=1 Tax=Nitzschia inconspicua TaxID=303405 RepID=A0A9K3KIE4_9STRA|nr:CRAL/TRIO domain containing protein [Nitzschia inconspicua]KAG7343659.1 CRAL/TRIO domain containing protein [Nitzschia inconspicua]